MSSTSTAGMLNPPTVSRLPQSLTCPTCTSQDNHKVQESRGKADRSGLKAAKFIGSCTCACGAAPALRECLNLLSEYENISGVGGYSQRDLGSPWPVIALEYYPEERAKLNTCASTVQLGFA